MFMICVYRMAYLDPIWGTRCNYVVERPLVVRCVVGSIPHGGTSDQLLTSSNIPRPVYQKPWYVIFCLRDGTYKISQADNLEW